MDNFTLLRQLARMKGSHVEHVSPKIEYHMCSTGYTSLIALFETRIRLLIENHNRVEIVSDTFLHRIYCPLHVRRSLQRSHR